RYGSPRTVIPDVVAKSRADLLLLGTHGRAGIAHALLGTVAGDVLRDVTCDVLVVPPRRHGVRKS
ncbi:universal stress protein, partial [Myxococcus sp. CA056]